MSQIEIAKAVATIAHRGQVDKAGNPYIEHPGRVATALADRGEHAEIIAAGWLHDVLEDTDLTRDDLLAAGVTWAVIHVVEAVTRTPGQPVEDYYEQVRAGSGAVRVKLADIADNVDPARLALLDDATTVRLTRKYAKARRLIAGVRQ